MAGLYLADKKHEGPPTAILGPDGTYLVSAKNHDIIKIGDTEIWAEGGIIRMIGAEGRYQTVLPSVFAENLQCLREMAEHALDRETCSTDLHAKLAFFGAKSIDEVHRWYHEGMRLVHACRVHGAPEDPGGPAAHKARQPKHFT